MIDGAVYIVVLRNALTVNGMPVNSWRLVLAGTPDMCLYLDYDRTSGALRPCLRAYPAPEDGRQVPGRHIGGDARTLMTILLPTQGGVRVVDLEAARAATSNLVFGRGPSEGARYIAMVLKAWSKGQDAILDESRDVGFNMLGAAVTGKVAEEERAIAAGAWRGPVHFIYIPDGREVLYTQLN
ncbi:hypothetical protein CALVIDRAFT_266425 [Calocera viscosa TUFC12733]|uniref:Uncharacterized protein n=1 Tax=Calocera viscosa (strain TUFC12733) TaxID=1330018 RepID=A0A167IWQ1_CALVF|nr:hypothetical protein CALVIDRAFT_266425 [Calocera viscosa TUFC12733]